MFWLGRIDSDKVVVVDEVFNFIVIVLLVYDHNDVTLVCFCE